jgi:hypothetical protein
MIYFTFLAALLLSGIAAYYSVIGLAAIFMGAFWPVVFMGSTLEFAKLVTASWLYRNWKTSPVLLKIYLTASVMLLMLITSMGIFGFLAKSHIDSSLDSGSNNIEVKTIVAQEKIANDRMNYLLKRAKDPSTASYRLDKQIQDTQKEISELTKRKLPLLKEENRLTADVGPIKYVAELIYGKEDGSVDKAVRLVIMLIMLVFDPLAVLLLISANISLKENENKPKSTETISMAKDLANKDDKEEVLQIRKENIATIKTLEPKYDYDVPFSFKEKS